MTILCKVCQVRPANRPGGLCPGCHKAANPNFTQPHVPQVLRDLRRVYAGKVKDNDSEAVKNLVLAFRDNPMKFMDALKGEESDYRKAVEKATAEAREKDAAQKERAEAMEQVGDVDLPREPVEDLIEELLGAMREPHSCVLCGRPAEAKA